jgi:hypothetical protein
MQFQNIWDELMEEVEELVASGESRREVEEWAQEQYDAYAAEANSWIYGPGEPVWDVQGRL